MNQQVNLFIAFGGGILAFFSPCFLPVIPAYLIYITGMSFDEIKGVQLKTVIHSILFIFGFGVIFTLLGLAAGFIGGSLFVFRDILRVAGGGLIIFLGLYLAGVLKLPFLDIEKRLTISKKPAGYLGTILVGMIFALGWSPCVGTILAAILTLAAQGATTGQAGLMLATFSLGLGVPLFLVSLAVEISLSFLKKIRKYLGVIHFVCGLFLVIVGILLVMDYWQAISLWLIDLTGYQGI